MFVVTGVLLVNMLVAVLDLPIWVHLALFAASTCLMLWLVWTVLQDQGRSMKEFPDQQEWGYQDRSDLSS